MERRNPPRRSHHHEPVPAGSQLRCLAYITRIIILCHFVFVFRQGHCYRQQAASISSRPEQPPCTPPPALSRLQPVPVAFPSDDNPFAEGKSAEQDENKYISSNTVIYRSSNTRSRMRIGSQSESAGYSYPMRQSQPTETFAREKAAADKEARSKVVASILLNRVNVVGKPMRRRPRNVDLDGPRTYVRSGLGRCVSVAE